MHYPATNAIEQVTNKDLLVLAPADVSIVSKEAKERGNKAILHLHL